MFNVNSFQRSLLYFRIVVSVGLISFIFMPAREVQAASITVNSLLNTTNNADGVCTIREAIINANNDAATWTNCPAGTGAGVISFSVVGTIAGVIIWSALQRAGAVSSIEGFIESVFLVEDFRFEGGDIFRIGVLGGMVGVLVLTLLTVLAGGLFNLISDLTGGVRVSVVQLESARPVPARRRR